MELISIRTVLVSKAIVIRVRSYLEGQGLRSGSETNYSGIFLIGFYTINGVSEEGYVCLSIIAVSMSGNWKYI
jgi:hypothetical protein